MDYVPLYIKPIQHKHLRRARWHNYSAQGTYMLTIVVRNRLPLLGSLYANPSPFVRLSDLGACIMDAEFAKISAIYPMVDVIKVCIMPDHIHFIVHVHSEMPMGKHLGIVVGAFKGGCTRAWKRLRGIKDSNLSLFEENYNDRILMDDGQLARWINYLDDNPRRLALKRQNPQLFTTVHDLDVCGTKCQVYGNQFLLDIPDKCAVIVHRADSDAVYTENFNKWMACGERGGVLVGTGIAPREKTAMREAMNRGYSLIVLREMGFSQYYKPSGEAFDACNEGRLLQISPWDYHYDKRKVTRGQCLELNALAERLEAWSKLNTPG